MSHKSLAVGTFLVLLSIIAVGTFLATTSILPAINPVAALTALTVAFLGFVWFKRTRS